MHNIYSSPEKFGLETIAEIDYSSGAYEFDRRVVWRARDGRLLTAQDSGCSCPTPFEVHGLEDLEDASYARLRDEAHEALRNGRYVTAEQVGSFLAKVASA